MNITDMYNASRASVVMAQSYARKKETGNTENTTATSGSANPTTSVSRYVSPTEMANNAEKTIEDYNKKIKAGGETAAKAAKEFAESDTGKALAKAGVTQNKDGTLSMDRDKFKAAASANSTNISASMDKVGKMGTTESKPAASAPATTNTNTTPSTVSMGRYVSPGEMAYNAEKTIEAYNKKIKAGGATAANAAKDMAGSDMEKELAKAGITRNSDGTLSMDRDKFKAAASANSGNVNNTMDKVAKSGSGETKTTASTTATGTTTTGTTSTSSTASSAAKGIDRSPQARKKEQEQLDSNLQNSAETRRREQEQFEAKLNKKYQSYSAGSNGQRLGLVA